MEALEQSRYAAGVGKERPRGFFSDHKRGVGSRATGKRAAAWAAAASERGHGGGTPAVASSLVAMVVTEASSPMRSSSRGGFFSVGSGSGGASGCGERSNT
jgi:hypothetical protein